VLLRAHQKAGHFLQGLPAPAGPQPFEAVGTVLGPYKLLAPLGEGGFGVVYRAEQTQPVRRHVALKVLRPGMDSRPVIARFEAERQALALMDHPHIARVLDAGEAPPAYAGGASRPYFVMELVEGVPLTDFCDRERLPPRERLGLFADVCQAVQHAHQKGIIHRDLKPSNVLVTRQDGQPVVKVIDFGIAKALDQRLTDKTLVTGAAQVIGTPLYMSPEQAEPGGLDIDTRSDIYSLGVLLYELLTGTTPFDRERLHNASFDELRRIIREEEPPRPSTRISTLGPVAATLSDQRRSDPRQLRRLLRGELDWIVMKCLEKDRNRRYETAAALARDIERYLADEPVEAGPPSAGYRLRKFARKYRRGLLTSGAFLGLLLVGGVVTAGQAVRLAHAERDQAIQQARRNLEVHAALDRATELRVQARSAKASDPGRWAEARAMARRAEALLETGPVDPGLAERVESLLRELEQEEKDRRMVATIEAVRLRGADLKDGSFDTIGKGPRYAEAFRAYGLNLEALDVAEAGRRVRESAIREELVAALYDWWIYGIVTEAITQKLWAVAGAADDNAWRRQFRDCVERKDWARLRELTRDDQVLRQPAPVQLLLGMVLDRVGMLDEAVAWLRKAQLYHPGDFWIASDLALLLMQRQRPPKLDEATAALRAALALRPDSPGVQMNLGVALFRQGNVSAAVICFQQALALEPSYVMAHGWLAKAREAQGDLRGALASYRRVLDLDPQSAETHYLIGEVLEKLGDRPGALASCRRAVEIAPGSFDAHHNLASMQMNCGDPRGAVGSFRRALEINPQSGISHYGLGMALRLLGDLRGGEASCRRAAEGDAKYFEAHFDLGKFADARGDWAGAAASYRKAVAAQPQSAEAHCNLGHALIKLGDLRTALSELQTGHNLGSRRKGWPYNSAKWVRDCQRFLQLEARLPSLLRGEAKPASTAERVDLARLCQFKKLYVSSARFFTEAFAADARLADNVVSGLPDAAAAAAALAGCGQGEEAARLPEAERAPLRRQALAWLRATLAGHGTALKNGEASAREQAQETLYLWQNDPALAGVRDAGALAKLPADERAGWEEFWAQVAAVRTEACAPK
jgi:serine/threonine-protein kinase